MCEPATIAAGAAMLAASAMQAYNQRQQGKYQAKVADQNADIAEAQAQDSVNRGNIAADQRRREMRQQAGAANAAMGAAGTDLTTGSALDVFSDSAMFGELDALTTVNNAQREAYGYQVQGMNATSQGRAAKSASNAAAMQTLLTAPLNAYGAYQMGGGTWSPFTQSKAAPITAVAGTSAVR